MTTQLPTTTNQAISPAAQEELGQIAQIKDFLAKPSDKNVLIDLKEYFVGTDIKYTVTTSDEDVIAAKITDDNKLALELKDFGVSDIQITVEDPKTGRVLSDDFRVRAVGENSYSIAVLPDTQDYTNAGKSHIYEGMTQWLVDHAETLNIAFVTHVGDITYGDTSVGQWPFVQKAMDKLAGVIPFGMAMGNHDGSHNNFGESFVGDFYSVDRLEEMFPDNFGGTYDMEPERTENTYWTFTAPDGTKWLSLNLEFGARADVIRWAGDVIEGHMDHKVMISSHAYMDWTSRADSTSKSLLSEGGGPDYGIGKSPEQATDGETQFRELAQKYPNVVFAFGGHVFGDGAETVVSYNQHGEPVYQMLANYQNGVAGTITSANGLGSATNGGNGAMRLLTIDPENGKVYTGTYFDVFDKYLTGSIRADELDRDELGGPLRGHDEVFDLDLSGPAKAYAVAKAGDDKFVSLEAEEKTAKVTLDGDQTVNAGKAELTYKWLDEDGVTVSTEAKPVLELAAGQHRLALHVTDAEGHSSVDQVLVNVGDENTLLMQNFNDGKMTGWVGEVNPLKLTTATAAEHKITDIGDADAKVTYIPALNAQQGVKVTLPVDGDSPSVVKSYSLVYDVLVKPGVKSYFSFLQTNPNNTDDQDLALKNLSATGGGIGINSDYEGVVKYGEWNRISFTITDQGNSALISKYINGEKVGETVQSGGNYARYAIDLEKGFLLFADESGETWDGYVSNVLFTDKVLTAAEISALGDAKPGNIVDAAPTPNSIQIDFSDPDLPDSFGHASVTAGAITAAKTNFATKGTFASHDPSEIAEGMPAVEGRLFEQSGSENNKLVWSGEGSKNWSDYSFEATLQNTGQNELGMVFYYKDKDKDKDKDNHYSVVFDVDTNTRSLIKTVGGVETVLASTHADTPFAQDFQLKVAVDGNEIRAFLDGNDIFGTVVDAAPLSGGTVGFYSDMQFRSQFDNATVSKNTLTAHAGSDIELVDLNGAGEIAATLTATGSYGPADIATYEWFDADGDMIATGATPTVDLSTGQHNLTLKVTDSAGNSSSDIVGVKVLAQDKVLAADDFSGENLSAWTIVDEGEFGGVGAEGKSSQWELNDGKLVQLTDLESRQLTYEGSNNADPWKTGWSPLGDGTNILRRGTYALYNDEDALEWSDYAIETTVQTPDNGALGVMFYYQDANNYYKLELDANGTNDYAPGNNVGSLFQLIQVKDGVEQVLTKMHARYTPDEEFQLRVEIEDNKIQASLDGMDLFAYPIETHVHSKGGFALYSWSNKGLTFDNVVVTSLKNESVPDTTITGDGVLVGTDGDDVLIGQAKDDSLFANAGNDSVKGAGGDDVLVGGEGNDTLEGGAGSDTYIYQAGHGTDVITETASEIGNDILVMQNLGSDQLTFYKHGNDVQIKSIGENDHITLVGQLASDGVELITLGDGTVMQSNDNH